MLARMIPQTVLRSEAFAAEVAVVLLRVLSDAVNHALVRDQVRLLRVSLVAVLADEGLGAQVARPVILQLVIRHEALVALLATIAEVLLVHSSIVRPQGYSVRRGEAARLARVLDAAVGLHVSDQLRRAFERLLADRALVRTHVAVLHHVSLKFTLSHEEHLAGRTLVLHPFLLPSLPSSLSRVDRRTVSTFTARASHRATRRVGRLFRYYFLFLFLTQQILHDCVGIYC